MRNNSILLLKLQAQFILNWIRLMKVPLNFSGRNLHAGNARHWNKILEYALYWMDHNQTSDNIEKYCSFSIIHCNCTYNIPESCDGLGGQKQNFCTDTAHLQAPLHSFTLKADPPKTHRCQSGFSTQMNGRACMYQIAKCAFDCTYIWTRATVCT